MIVGVTGKYCAGKNEVVRIFEEAGYPVIDVDRIGHKALEARRAEVLRRFGQKILLPNGEIDRKRLGSIVFRRREDLKALEEIVHPDMVQSVTELTGGPENRTAGRAVINAALLFSMGLDELCGRIIVVQAPLLERIHRGIKRDDLSTAAILKRIWFQRKLIPQPSPRPADTIIVENSGTQGTLREKIIRILPELAG
jgi:dephospho-CoA kinase